jgi:antitoxin component HigA of HigAB toxin-antitoxin module
MNENWTEQRHQKMLDRIDKLMDAEAGTPESFELRWLADRVVAYEDVHYPIGAPE